MADGTVEYVGKNAVGDELGLMPNGYYFWSPQSIDTRCKSDIQTETERGTDFCFMGAVSSKYLRIPRMVAPLKYSVCVFIFPSPLYQPER